MAPGPPLAVQGGWKFEGAGKYDVGMFSNIQGNAVRISNGIMSGSFGDWLFSPALNTPATETGDQEFVAEFDLKSMVPNELQPGLQISVAPQSADGARMSFLKFTDTEAGIVVGFSDVMNLPGTVGYYPAAEDWRSVNIATLDRSQPHHVKLVMNLLEGPHNDVVQVYIDGGAGLVAGRPGGEAEFNGFFAPVDNQPTINKAKAGQTIPMKWKLSAPSFATSWEDYYRYNTESNAGLGIGPFVSRQVDSLVFQARCASDDVCANTAVTDNGTPVNGNGFLIDNVSFTSSPIVTALSIDTESVTDPSAYGSPVFTTALSAAAECGSANGMDPLESYAPPGASGLTYNEATGVWHYNVQTPKSWAGKCVEMTLNGFGESTLFKFVK